MYTSYMDDVFSPRVDKDAFLFDNPEEIPASGNIDPLDEVKSVCLSCGRTNGDHDPSCTEDL